jgi:TonB family protein
MRDRRIPGLAGLSLPLLLCLPQMPAAAQSEASPPAAARTAHLALITNFSARCPELKRADPGEEAIAVVVFRVGVTGLPSDASISSSSHSAALDAAAMSCVMKLRFQPATRPGDGEAVASWQQLALRWLRPSAHAAESGSMSAPGSTPAAGSTSAAPVAMPALTPAPAPAGLPPHAQPPDARVDVRVCVDGEGKLAQRPTVVRSSGDAQFDAAALRVAQSASGSYRAVTGADAATGSDCVPLTLSLEQR